MSTSGTSASPQQTIALIDDDDAMREALRDLLESAGLCGLAFSSAELFLAHAGRAGASCIVLDVRLPGISGLALHRLLVESGNSVPVLFLTSVDDPQARERALRLGAKAYFLKPVDSAELLSWIQRCCEAAW